MSDWSLTAERYGHIVNSLIDIFHDNNEYIQQHQSLWKDFFQFLQKIQEEYINIYEDYKDCYWIKKVYLFFPIEVCSGNSESLDPESISSHWEVTE